MKIRYKQRGRATIAVTCAMAATVAVVASGCSGGGSDGPEGAESIMMPSASPTPSETIEAAEAIDTSDWTTISSGPTPAPEDASWPATMYFLDLRTGAQTLVAGDLLSEDLDNAWYVFSPDGTRVAYNRCSEGPCAIVNEIRVGDAGGTRTDATFEGEHALAWSPDGTKLVYSAPNSIHNADDPNLYVRDLATGETTELLDAGTAGWLRTVDFGPNDVDVSPDGDTVIFSRPRDSSGDQPAWDVWSVPITGGGSTLVIPNAPDRGTANLRYLYAPQYLADGEQIAFPQSDRLLSVAAPGRSPQPFVTTDVPMWAFAMSPDRSRIAYDTEEGTHVVNLATGEDQLVTGGQRARWVGNDTLFVEVPR